LYPETSLEVLVFHDRLALCCGIVAEPVRVRVGEGLEALLRNVALADAVPARMGT
jgi:hypothetical protein